MFLTKSLLDQKHSANLKRPWCWERLRVGIEEDGRGWDCWVASPTRWTLVWVDSRSLWWTERPGVLRFMGSQSVRHNWTSEVNWICIIYLWMCSFSGVREYGSNGQILSKKFVASNSWEIREHLVLDFVGKKKVWTLHKVASLERYDSLIMDSKTLTQPMDWYWLNLKCRAGLDFQRRVSKGHWDL